MCSERALDFATCWDSYSLVIKQLIDIILIFKSNSGIPIRVRISVLAHQHQAIPSLHLLPDLLQVKVPPKQHAQHQNSDQSDKGELSWDLSNPSLELNHIQTYGLHFDFNLFKIAIKQDLDIVFFLCPKIIL